jgi:hypothetical protein
VSGPDQIELVRALYEDVLIATALGAHDVPRVPPGGPIWERFPDSVPLSISLVKDLYWNCGIGLNHIELLTGRPEPVPAARADGIMTAVNVSETRGTRPAGAPLG